MQTNRVGEETISLIHFSYKEIEKEGTGFAVCRKRDCLIPRAESLEAHIYKICMFDAVATVIVKKNV